MFAFLLSFIAAVGGSFGTWLAPTDAGLILAGILCAAGVVGMTAAAHRL